MSEHPDRRRSRRLLVTRTAGRMAAALATAFATAGPAAAQGWIEPHPGGRPAVERIRSDVRIRVDGERRIAHIVVEEEFHNPTGRMLEGDYLYPIPPAAVFTDLSLHVGGRELKGEMMDAERARRIYEEIVRRRKDPALVELFGHGVLRSRVFPIGPGESRRVTLRYTQVLHGESDFLRIRYPRTLAVPPGLEPVSIESGERVRPRRIDRARFSLQVHVTGASRFATPYSPTHTIDVRDARSDEMDIVLDDRDAAHRDFELILPFRETWIGATVLTHARLDEDGYFMLLISPPRAPDEVRIPRDLTLVLDVSGSMSGEKIEQARLALGQLLAGLRPDDRFRLITFSSVVRAFRPEFSGATSANLGAAREFLEEVRAEGSTHIMGALEEALRPEAGSDRLSIVVFLTDGRPTVGETAPERIVERAAGLLDGERVFAFGVGHDVNTFLIDRLVEGGRGSAAYVRPQEDVEIAVASLGRRLRYPALAELRIIDAPVALEDRYPDPLPDLFYGEELVLFGRYRGQGAGELVLEGRRAGRSERLSYRVSFARREADNEFIPRLWAARKAGALATHLRLHGYDPEIVEELRTLGLRYGILTEYTSYLVEEPELAFDADARRELADRARRLSAAPAAQTGATAFERADRGQTLMRASRLADAEVAELRVAGGEGHPGGVGMEARRVAGRLFVHRDGVWTDVAHDPSLPVVRIAPFGPAYFELADRLPGLRAALAVGERALLAGDGLSLELAPDAAERWSGDQLERILHAFRAYR